MRISDDAAAERRLLAEVLSTVPVLSVVGLAANGWIGRKMMPVVPPDVVVLDLEMPEMDGCLVLALLRATDPKLPVVVFSGTPYLRGPWPRSTLSHWGRLIRRRPGCHLARRTAPDRPEARR